ncbi:MAG: hypothetical protein ABI791_07465 [Acidobacteriota bacterium]
MIDADSAHQVIEQYKKHGWVLRRVLFSSPLSPLVAKLAEGTPTQKAAIDALWFSRRSLPDCEAWELRRLSGSPFALVEVIYDSTDPEAIESVLSGVESRMSAGSGPVSH